MTPAQIESLIVGWIEAELEADEDLRADGPPLSDEERDGITDILGDQLEETWSALVGNNLTSVEGIADGLLAGQGVKPEKDSTAYRRLCRELLKARMHVLKTGMQRMDGDYSMPLPSRGLNGISAVAAPSPAPVTKLFSMVSEAYLSEFKNRQPRTQGMIRSGFTKFLEATGGDRPIGNISKTDCRTYKETMAAAGLVAATVNKHISNLNHCDKTLKNAQSRRVVPMPQLLLDLGFVEYVRSIRHKRLFPQLKHGGNGYGDGPGKAWARLVLQLKQGGKGQGAALAPAWWNIQDE